LTAPSCPTCGASLEPDMAFCPECGHSLRGVAPAMAPPGQPMGPSGIALPAYAWSPHMRPLRNPRQTASVAAGVMTLVAGIFALVWGVVILTFDGLERAWEGSDWEIVPIPFTVGVFYISGFAISLAGAYVSFRLMRFPLALAAPLLLVIDYFLSILYEPFVLFVFVEMLLLSIIALALLLWARPAYGGETTLAPLRRDGSLMTGAPPPIR
jgi:hypothetical protein